MASSLLNFGVTSWQIRSEINYKKYTVSG